MGKKQKKEIKKLKKKIRTLSAKKAFKESTPRHFINLPDIGAKTLRKILDNAHKMKEERFRHLQILDKQGLLLVTDKNSFRTLLSFDQGMKQLGGETTFITREMIHPAESVHDMAKVAEGMVDAVMIRWSDHNFVEEWAKYSRIPVINALTDKSHPCQIMADLMTIEEHGKELKGLNISWFGDANNVCKTFAEAAGLFKFNFTVCPPNDATQKTKLANPVFKDKRIKIEFDPKKAAKAADVVVTDTWVSMGQKDGGKAVFEHLKVTPGLMKLANKDAFFMHCLPAHRGEEVVDAVIDSKQSIVFPEAHNRLHIQKAILAYCLENSGVRPKYRHPKVA